LEDLNPITVSKQVVLEEYDALRMGPNKSCQAFFDRFRKWQSRAKNYGFQYKEITGFVARLTKPLHNKLISLMAMEDQRQTPISFLQVVMAALDEDRCYRKNQVLATASTNGSASNKQSVTGGNKQPKKKAADPTHCFNCGKDGHISAKCPKPKTKKQKAYKAAKAKELPAPLK
jgi:hypothetical protein